jgi:hypothetical protein
MRRLHIRPWEPLVKQFTRRRPHRREDCRWRGWVIHVHHKRGEPDLAAIDSSLAKK